MACPNGAGPVAAPAADEPRNDLLAQQIDSHNIAGLIVLQAQWLVARFALTTASAETVAFLHFRKAR